METATLVPGKYFDGKIESMISFPMALDGDQMAVAAAYQHKSLGLPIPKGDATDYQSRLLYYMANFTVDELRQKVEDMGGVFGD